MIKSVVANAKELLTSLSLYQLPVDPVVVCKKLEIIYDEQPYEGFDGCLIVMGDKQLIGVNSGIIESGRKAFTCAHELGHAYYDVELATSFHCTRDDVGYGRQKLEPIEVRANEFASELLLPQELFLKEIGKSDPSWKLLSDLSRRFGTSLQATANRFVKLSHHSCWLVVVKDGVIQRYTKADHNDFAPQVQKSFKPPTIDPGEFRETFASSWLYNSHKIKNKKILFWPLPKNRYQESPILLWDKGNSLLNDNFSGDEFDDEMARLDDDIYRRGRY